MFVPMNMVLKRYWACACQTSNKCQP